MSPRAVFYLELGVFYVAAALMIAIAFWPDRNRP